MDAFFAAIEERDNPQFRGKPIAVGADPQGGKGRGVVSTANYAARKYGIHSALPISRAWKLSEDARKRGEAPVVFLPGSMKHYIETSEDIMNIVRQFVKDVGQVGADEAYLDLTRTVSHQPRAKSSEEKEWEQAIRTAKKIKAEIKRKEKLTASIGIAPNKLVAKIASDMQKPDGLTVVKPKEALKFLASLEVRRIPGIGPKTEAELLKYNVKTIHDLRKLPKAKLIALFGKWGAAMYDKARGKDDSPVVEEQETKSIGEQHTFEEDVKSLGTVTDALKEMAEGVMRTFKNDGFQTFKRIVLMVRFADFETITRSRTLKEATDSPDVLRRNILQMVLPFFDRRENPKKKKIRLVGLRLEGVA